MRKRMRFFAAAVLTALLTLAGCGTDAPHPAEMSDTAAVPEETLPPSSDLILASGGETRYTIVRGDNADPAEVEAAVFLRRYMEQCGIRVPITTDFKKNPVSEYEIVVGETTRTAGQGNTVDVHDMGLEGYFVAVSGSRIYLRGGSPASAADAVELFLTEFFGYTGDAEKASPVTDVKIPGDYFRSVRQEYALEAITVAETDLNSFRIRIDGNDPTVREAAVRIQEFLYAYCGAWLEILPADAQYSGPCMIFGADAPAGRGTFEMKAENGNLVLRTDTEMGFLRGWYRFFAEHVKGKSGTLPLSASFAYTAELMREVRYCEFGAAGDGVTDDSSAIADTHAYANRMRLPVKADAGAVYYIGVLEETIPVRTDVDWRGAKLIIDDSLIRYDDAKHRGVWVFTILPDTEPAKIAVPDGMSLTKGQNNLGMTFEKSCMLKIENAGEKINLRYGENANNGVNRHEYILVDKDGNVDPSTPIQYDYRQITAITQYTVNDAPISLGNGYIETIAPNPKKDDPDYDNQYYYYARGIMVRRSNVTLHDIDHTKTGEDKAYMIDRNGDGKIEIYGADKPFGVPYSGFFSFKFCANAEMRDCRIQGHQAYNFYMPNGARNECGSYELNSEGTIGLTFRNLRQKENPETGETITNRTMYHGIMGSNYCRNLLVENCYMDRFDSHQGMYNAVIRDSVLGFGILVIGGGTLRIENVTRLSGDAFILLRTDYNSIFDGDVILKNCTAGESVACLIRGRWISFYNGLPNHMTGRVEIDGLTAAHPNFSLFAISGSGIGNALTDAVNPLIPPKEITVRGMDKAPQLTEKKEQEVLFAETVFTVN